MNFSAVPSGTSLFVDANVFVYAIAEDPKYGKPCIDLLERIELGDLRGMISAQVLSEVAHRLMTLEACETFAWPYAGIAQRLRRHPAELRKLAKFRAALSQQHGLLSNDASILAVMEDQGLTHLASNDSDFDRVTAITRYSPV
jgi:predicted nucleic acid-binding protein